MSVPTPTAVAVEQCVHAVAHALTAATHAGLRCRTSLLRTQYDQWVREMSAQVLIALITIQKHGESNVNTYHALREIRRLTYALFVNPDGSEYPQHLLNWNPINTEIVWDSESKTSQG